MFLTDFKCCKNTRHGMPDRIRTCDLQSRSLTLYPTELRAHMLFKVNLIISNLPGVVKHWRMKIRNSCARQNRVCPCQSRVCNPQYTAHTDIAAVATVSAPGTLSRAGSRIYVIPRACRRYRNRRPRCCQQRRQSHRSQCRYRCPCRPQPAT